MVCYVHRSHYAPRTLDLQFNLRTHDLGLWTHNLQVNLRIHRTDVTKVDYVSSINSNLDCH